MKNNTFLISQRAGAQQFIKHIYLMIILLYVKFTERVLENRMSVQ